MASLSLRHYGASPGSHTHPHFQLLWGWQGTLELEIDGRGDRVRAGQLAVIAPGERHDFASRDGSHCFVIDADGVDTRWADVAGRVLAAQPDSLHLLRFLAARERFDEHAAALLLSTVPPVAATPAPARRHIDWAALDAWIDAHLAQPITVADLAARVFLAESQFTERCVEATGLSPMAYVRARRLGMARRLRDAGWPVQRLAARCGYRSPSALTVALKRASR